MNDKLKDIADKYQEYLTLSYITSLNDPEEEPFVTKYIGRALLQKEIDRLETLNNPENEFPNNTGLDETEFMKDNEQQHLVATYNHFLQILNPRCMEAFKKPIKLFLVIKLLEFNLAKNYVETEEIETGQRLFTKLVQQLDSLSNSTTLSYDPILFNLKMSCFLELVFVWSNRSEYQKCYSILTSLEEMYNVYKAMADKDYLERSGSDQLFVSYPYDPSELVVLNFDLENADRKASIESLYTYSLFYLAQIHGKLDEKVKSATYCQLTLQRQIDEHADGMNRMKEEDNKSGTKTETKRFKQQPLEKINFDPLDWATVRIY